MTLLREIKAKKSFRVTKRKKNSKCDWCNQFDIGDTLIIEWKIPVTMNGGIFMSVFKSGSREFSVNE